MQLSQDRFERLCALGFLKKPSLITLFFEAGRIDIRDGPTFISQYTSNWTAKLASFSNVGIVLNSPSLTITTDRHWCYLITSVHG
ncbi:hypothetical protein GCM10027341_15200 [Spirosoma knui]